jgi:hypothetical protein
VIACLAALLSLVSVSVFAQGGSTKTALSGTVVDSAGGVIPGATVVVKNTETGVTFNTITNADGAFSVPALDPGTYSVAVSLSGFKTSVVQNQRLVAASPASIKVTLEVGNFTDTIEVKGGSELIQTQSGSVSSTLMTEQLKTIPLPTRNALYAVNLLPGVDTTGTVRDSTINGLPEQTINITLDGVNVNNNQDKAGDGFYAMVRPQLDAIEQVTLTTAAQGAESAGQGAVQIRFVTRSGTNQYRGTFYDYFRHPALNTNSWINEKNGLDKNRIILHQVGGSFGGPIQLPKMYDGTGKAFFFFNYEEFYQPTEATRTRTLLNPDAQRGVFSYNVTSGGQTVTRQVNLFELAARNGQTSTMDPTMQALLAEIRTGAGTTGNISTLSGATNTQQYIFQSPGKGVEHLPTTKLDFNLSTRHRLSGTYYWQEINRFPDIQNNGDVAFPGLPSYVNYLSHRTVGSVTLRSTLSPNLVNELVGGWQWSPNYFAANLSASQYENQQGFSLIMPLVTFATTPYGGTGANVGGEAPRNTPNWNIDDTVNLQRGRHSLSFGGSFTQVGYTQTLVTAVPQLSMGVQAGVDPADALFNPANFDGASTTNLNDARSLYALLTGRITAVNGTARLNENSEYVYIGTTSDRLRLTEIGTFAQDSWRVTPTLTLNGGVRWEVQLPIVALNSNYSTATMADICGPSGLGAGPGGRACNLFQPGVFNAPGMVPQYTQYKANEPGFHTDWNNFAPNVSAAWRPNAQHGFLRTILGDPEQATVRAGYSIAYNRNGMAEFQGTFAGNPGRSVNANRNNTLGNLVRPGESWPVLLREPGRLGPPATCTANGQTGCIPSSPVYPLTATTANSVNIFDPNIQLSYTESYQVGFQRALSQNTAIEVRYVGNQNKGGWVNENWNEINIYENGFLDEFKLAQQNLRSHIAAGCGAANNPCSFGYRGPGTGTSPLPIYLAHFTGQGAANASNAALYSNANFTNTTFVGRLNQYEPAITGNASASNDLFSSATFRANMVAAGLPNNFWVMNPLVANANVRTSASFTKYHSVQTEVRRRLSQGLLVSGSYTWSRRYGSVSDSLHFERVLRRSTDANNNIPHSIKLNGYYDLPFGRGKRFGSDWSPLVDGFAGGWSMSVTGRMFKRGLAIDDAVLVGMTLDELQSEYKFRIDASKTVTMLPDDIILNTRRAYDTSATSANGYGGLGAPEGRYIRPSSSAGCVRIRPGDCGEPVSIFLTAPLFTRFDLTLKKQVPLGGRKTFDIQIDVNNLFNNINFTPVFNPNSNTLFQTNAQYMDINQSYDPGGRLGQIVVRFSF